MPRTDDARAPKGAGANTTPRTTGHARNLAAFAAGEGAHPGAKRQERDAMPMCQRGALRLRDACTYTGLSRASCYRAVKAGLLSPLKLGGATAFRVRDLDALLDRAGRPGGIVLLEPRR